MFSLGLREETGVPGEKTQTPHRVFAAGIEPLHCETTGPLSESSLKLKIKLGIGGLWNVAMLNIYNMFNACNYKINTCNTTKTQTNVYLLLINRIFHLSRIVMADM